MRTLVITMLLVFCINNLFAQMPETLKVKEYTLSNGLTVWINEDHTQPKIFGAIVVKAGSKDCPNTGIAHYFEHMMFKGTDKIGTINYEAEKPILDSIARKYDELAQTKEEVARRKIQQEINDLSIQAAEYAIPNEFNRLISQYGGSQLNAGTSYDFTVYFNEFSPQYIAQWAEINSERLLNPVFRLFQSELETVYEEKNMYSDVMGASAMEKLMERYFYPHPYAYPIIGSTEHLKNPKLSEMRKFFEEYYVATNMGLILCGDFNTEEVLPILEKTFSRVRRGETPMKSTPPPPAFQGKETIKIKLPIPFMRAMALGFRGLPANHPDLIALNIAIGLLNNDNGTGYLDKLAVERKLLMAAGLNQNLNESGILGIAVLPKLPFQTYSSAEKLVWREIERIKQGDFPDEVFQSFKLAQKRNIESSLEDIKNRATVMMTLYSQGKSWEEYLNEIKEIDALQKEDIMRVAQQYFGENYLYATKKTGNYPKNKLPKPEFRPIVPKQMDAISEYAATLEKLPVKEVPLRFIDFDKDVTTTSINSLVTLYAKENPVNDIFTLWISYGKGGLDFPILPHVAAYLPYLGTNSMSFLEFREKLQTLGSTLQFEATDRVFVIKISGFDNNLKATLQLTGEFIRDVKADNKQVKQVADAEKVISKSFFKSSDNTANALYEKVKYGEISRYLNKLSLSEVKKLKGEELINAFNEVTQTACNLHYCGKLSAEAVKSEIEKYIPLNRIKLTAQRPDRQMMFYNKPVIYFFDDPKVSQSIIYGYTPIEKPLQPSDRSAAKLFTNYFGGDMSSLMFQEIREFRSLAYRVKADYELPPINGVNKGGCFTTTLSTQSDKTLDAMEVLNELLTNMPSKPERIRENQQRFLNEVNNSYPCFRDISSRISYWKREGYTEDPNKDLIKDVLNMNMDDVQTFYKSFIQDHPVVYIIVGNKKQIDFTKLASFGEIISVKKNDIYR